MDGNSAVIGRVVLVMVLLSLAFIRCRARYDPIAGELILQYGPPLKVFAVVCLLWPFVPLGLALYQNLFEEPFDDTNRAHSQATSPTRLVAMRLAEPCTESEFKAIARAPSCHSANIPQHSACYQPAAFLSEVRSPPWDAVLPAAPSTTPAPHCALKLSH